MFLYLIKPLQNKKKITLVFILIKGLQNKPNKKKYCYIKDELGLQNKKNYTCFDFDKRIAK